MRCSTWTLALASIASLLFAAAQPTGGAARAQLTGLDASRAMNQMKTPTDRASEAYSRGARAKRKAEKESDARKRQELYDRAKSELAKSIEYQPTYDAYLALGQVHLALGDTEAAGKACSEARSLKPTDDAAKTCLDAAAKPAASTATAAAATAAAPPAPAAPSAPAAPVGAAPAAGPAKDAAAPPPPPPPAA
jgi:hypothetical protein